MAYLFLFGCGHTAMADIRTMSESLNRRGKTDIIRLSLIRPTDGDAGGCCRRRRGRALRARGHTTVDAFRERGQRGESIFVAVAVVLLLCAWRWYSRKTETGRAMAAGDGGGDNNTRGARTSTKNKASQQW